jgi:hypothetical protein
LKNLPIGRGIAVKYTRRGGGVRGSLFVVYVVCGMQNQEERDKVLKKKKERKKERERNCPKKDCRIKGGRRGLPTATDTVVKSA